MACVRAPGLTVSTTVSFASLWVIPRLASFRARHPEVEVYVSADDRLIDLGRGEVDVAVRYLADASAPEGAVRLFGERMMPVVSPKLVRRGGTPLADSVRSRAARAAASRRSRRPHAVARLERAGSHANGQPGLKPVGSLRFKLLRPGDPGRGRRAGVALGRIPLIAEHLRDGRLTAPFPEALRLGARLLRGRSRRMRARRADVAGFVAWLAGRGRARARQARRRSRRRAAPRDRKRRVATAGQVTCRAFGAAPIRTRRDSEPSAWIERFAHRSSRPMRACSTSRADTAAMRATSPREAPNVVAVDRDAAALARPRGNRGHRDPRRSISKSGAWPLCGRAIRRDRRHELSASAACSRRCLRALAGDGVLLYETFARGNEAYGRPTNPDFLLEQDELLR